VNYAKRIQTAILPETKVILNYAKDYAVFWKPRDIVSGDFYWICEIVENQQKNLIVALADCTGHGVPGAFMSMIGNDLLNAIIIEKRIFSPENILEELDREIRKVLRQDATQSRDGMDIAVCKIIPDEKIVEFAGAKQPFYAFTNDGCEILIAGSKRNVGGMDLLKHQPFEKNIISYTDGLTFYLYSDGFQDQFGGKFPFSKFKSKPFREMLKKHHLLNFEEQMNTWEKILQDFTEENPNQTDDILILGIKL
jgi:serine phosphatase RsbU (regulator of sigma subunit)